MDRHDHKPHLNAPLFELAASGVGIRQAARTLGLSRRCTELKLRKISRHLRRLNLNLRDQLPREGRLHFDEFESFEGQRNTRPVTIPVLIDTETRYIIWAESATIRPRGKMTKARIEAIERTEERYGRRKDHSRRAIRRTLERGAAMVRNRPAVVLETDEKMIYPKIAARVFRKKALKHRRTSSKLARTVSNPLFPINHEEAMMRDLMGRLRRRSWLVSKKRRYLDLGLQLHMAYRNLVRRRFNDDEESAAQLLGFTPRRLTPHEVLSWRQEWGRRSVHPLSRRGKSVEDWFGMAA